MQAAIEASRRGHRVILCEKSDRLGGALKCEEKRSFKSKVKAYIEYQTAEISRSAIEVRLNTEVTKELAEGLEPDVIIAALGARPVKPKLAGIEGDNVLSAEEAYNNSGAVGKRAVVLGGGLVGTELAIYLASFGREVTVIELMPFLNSGGNILHQHALNVEIERYKIKLMLGTGAKEISLKGVLCQGADCTESFVEADTCIYAVGQAPLMRRPQP